MKRIVVKIGSSIIAPKGKIDSLLVNNLVKDILKTEKTKAKVILVSSGAIACGLDVLGHKRKPADVHSLMAISSIGQIVLMDVFNRAFNKHKRICAQILLTWDDFDNRRRFINIQKTIDKLLAINIIPVINENDAVSCEEICFGDNDRLSALVADLIEADKLIILSNVKGLLKDEKVVPKVEQVDTQILSLAKEEGRTHTTGGMIAKLNAIKIAASLGVETVIADGKEKDVISRINNKELLGTLFVADANKHKARKRWIAFSKKPKGIIFIDVGAKEALLNKGKSLLGVGIVKIEGSFKKRDAVVVLDDQGLAVGRGLINYSYDDLTDIKNKKFVKEVIHRNDFVRAS